MPFANTWDEELVAEWLQLEGYLIEVGLPVSVSQVGGRYEADIVGARVQGNKLEIYHIECGQLSGGKQSLDSLGQKFSSDNCAKIEEYFKRRFGFSGDNVSYHKMYIASYWTNPTLKGAKNLGITVRTLPDFIRNDIRQTIKKWKINAPHRPRTRGGYITLPKSCWLLYLIDYLSNKGLLQ